MIVFDCPTRPRTKSNSVVVEKFVSDLRQFVEKDLGRSLPNIQSNSLNRSLSFFESMPLCHRKMSRRLACKVDGCDNKGLMLSIAGDPYSDQVCVEHFAQKRGVLPPPPPGPCVDCGLKREESPSIRILVTGTLLSMSADASTYRYQMARANPRARCAA